MIDHWLAINQDRLVAEHVEGKLTNRILQTINTLFCRIFHDLEVVRPCTVPRTGPAIIISNHISGLDPLLIQSVCPRMVVWMMAREYFELKALRKGYEMIDAIPVDRSGRDMPATRAALRALEHGRVLGIFPEGKIETSHDLLPFQPGVTLLASKSQAPIVPVYLDGTQRNKNMVNAVLRPQRIRIAFGPLLHPPTAPRHGDEHRPSKLGTAQFTAAVSDVKQLIDRHRSARP